MVVASTNAFSKEMAIRKRIANIYNKREENFPSLREYNDYLEEVEDMIFNLIEGIDVPAFEAKIAQYQRENAEQIMIAQARKAEEYAAALAASKGQPAQSDGDALGQGSQAGSSTGPQGHYAPAIAGGIAQPRPTQPLPVGSFPDMLGGEYEDDEKMKLRTERAAKAGGWSLEISRKRALEEAFGSLWV
uniref:Putative CDK-activating kinase assembly factor MAT1-like n=1 Tax=Solanum chacoense TaxID=4108 RepID=A0A0V0HSA5_SOLCH